MSDRDTTDLNDRANRLLKSLGLDPTPDRVRLAAAEIEAAQQAQRDADAELCRTIAADIEGATGEPGNDLAEVARQCAFAIETGDAGAVDEVQAGAINSRAGA